MQNNLLWNLQYCEKNKRENSFYLYKSLEIEKFIKRFFKIYKLIINDFKLKYSNSNLEIFISYYTTMQSLKLLQKNLKVKSIVIKSKPNYKSKILKTKINSKSRFKLISFFKQKLLTNTYSSNYTKITNNFSEILLESLSLFTKRKLKIKLILQNLNKGVSFRLEKHYSKNFKEILIKFRKFTKFFFFKETINVLMLVIYKSVNLRLLTEFIAFQFSVIKRHNTFLIFLKQALFALQNSRFSRVHGIKIIVKGRLNGAPRSRKSIVKVGSVPLQNFESNILTSKSTSYTPNGTFSISAWSCVI